MIAETLDPSCRQPLSSVEDLASADSLRELRGKAIAVYVAYFESTSIPRVP